MNYRHSFHAGNFADLVKHALWLRLLAERQAAGPVTVFDTHAGAGLYDLTGDAARSKEAEAGVARLMAAQGGLPPTIQALADQVAALNPDGGVRFYPGSPVLTARNLRHGDAYRGFELRDEVKGLLDEALAAFPNASGQAGDGYDALIPAMGRVKSALVLIDPPYERGDDYHRAADAAIAARRSDPAAAVAIWTPLKDLETFDGFLRRLVPAGSALVAEARLRPLTDPMKMNGCAMVVLGATPAIEAAAKEVCGWTAATLGGPGAKAEIWRT